MKKLVLVVALAAVTSLSLGAAAQAQYLYNWDPMPAAPDPDDVGIDDGQDIFEGVWFGQEADSYYFRMDLEAPPEMAVGQFAGIYGVYLDTVAGGAIGANWDYVPNALDGVDYILDIHFDPALGGYWAGHFHVWNGTGFDLLSLTGWQASENGGRTLEMQITTDVLPEQFTMCGATHDMGSEVATYDLTDCVQVPEPGSLALLALGGIMLLRRR